MSALRLGTRRSRLATTQSQWVAGRLRALGHDVDIVEIVTEGDTNAAPLTQIGGTGVFASAIRRALHERRIDVAVHSLKDLPVVPEAGLVVAGIPVREDPRDALVGARRVDLASGARVGTGSPRRAAQLAATRPDLEVVPIRGNVDSRIARVGADLDAVVLAASGLARLGRLHEVAEIIPAEAMLPAPGQGALGVECRTDAPEVATALAAIDDADSRLTVTAERALLAALEAGCTAPIGALARLEPSFGSADPTTGRELVLTAFAGSDDGRIALRDEIRGPADGAESLGAALAQRLLDAGADGIAATIRQRDHPGGTAIVPTAHSNVPPHERSQELPT